MHNKFCAFCVRKLNNICSYSIYDTIGNINRSRSKKAVFFAVTFALANTVTFAAQETVDVTIAVNGEYTNAYTSKTTVGSVLEENGIILGEYDIVTPDVDHNIVDDQVIVVERVKKVTIVDGGVTSEYYTTKNTVGEVLASNGISLGFYDILDKSINDELDVNTVVNITRVVKTTISVDESIPFRTVTAESQSLLEGTTRVTSNGAEGVLTTKYEVYLHNGVEVSRNEISSEVTKKPVNKVISIGTRPHPGQAPRNYKRVLTCTATAYDLSYESCGKHPGDRGYGITATGTYAKYGTVAVDPRVIPLGSKLYIETADGSFAYGYATAEDTGGAIKGNKVDLFFPTYDECINFGRRSVKVYILE